MLNLGIGTSVAARSRTNDSGLKFCPALFRTGGVQNNKQPNFAT